MRYRGNNVKVTWIWAGGTLDMSGESRGVTVSSNIDTIDATAGHDKARQYIAGPVTWEVLWSGVAQNNSGAPQGTLYAQALQPAQRGTLIVSPYGTATGYLVYVGEGISNGLVTTLPYSDVTSLTAKWTVSSASGSGMGVGAYGSFMVGIGIVGTSTIGA